MAMKKSFFSKRNNLINPDPIFDFDESDWNSNQTPSSDHKKTIRNSRILNKSFSKCGDDRVVVGATASSLPVNVPDWSKILREEYRGGNRDKFHEDEDDDEEVDGGNNKVPPHEYLARRFAKAGIASSFSVHEGIGRTLKGRDLSRVRNAIWEKTGFQD